MPRLLGDHRQRERAKLAIIERPSVPAPAATFAKMSVMPPVTAIRQVIGKGETTVKTASVCVFHTADIDLDIS